MQKYLDWQDMYGKKNSTGQTKVDEHSFET